MLPTRTNHMASATLPTAAPAVALRDVRKVHGKGDGAVVADERPRPTAGTGVDAVIRAVRAAGP